MKILLSEFSYSSSFSMLIEEFIIYIEKRSMPLTTINTTIMYHLSMLPATHNITDSSLVRPVTIALLLYTEPPLSSVRLHNTGVTNMRGAFN